MGLIIAPGETTFEVMPVSFNCLANEIDKLCLAAKVAL